MVLGELIQETEPVDNLEGLPIDPVRVILHSLGANREPSENIYGSEEALRLIDAGRIWQVMNHLDRFNIDGEVFARMVESISQDRLKELIIDAHSIDKATILEMLRSWEDEDFIDKLVSAKNITVGNEQINQSDLTRFSEKLVVDQNFDQVESGDGTLDYARVFEVLSRDLKAWQDEANVGHPFRQGADIFGHRNMFRFINRSDVTRHDQLFAFGSVVGMYEAYRSLHPKLFEERARNIFVSKILLQVRDDQTSYNGTSTSYHRLNEITQSFDFSEESIDKLRSQLQRIEELGFVDEMAKLRDMLDHQSYFDSWKSLNNFVELTEQLKRADIFEKLSVLKMESTNDPRKAKLYEYVKTLMYHQDSMVDISAAEQFFLRPDDFLDRDDKHAPKQVHNALKPSNYTEIPHLDLSAQELIEALASGEIDRIQAFPSMEIIYEVNETDQDKTNETETEPEPSRTFVQTIIDELGSSKNGNVNRKLFSQLSKLLHQYQLKIDTSNLEQSIGAALAANPDLSAEVEKLLNQYPNHINADRKKLSGSGGTKRYRATVYPKSDPQGVLAGNDTACCMPFGSGKNNVYMFNPNCALFALQVEKSDGTWRTIAQSVLTLDQDIGVNPSSIVSGGTIPESAGGGEASFIACDNIEVTPNSKNADSQRIIGEIYQAFFQNYARVFNQSNLTGRTVSTSKIVVGQGYSDFRFGRSESNTYLPRAPVSYSDKLGANVDVIDLINPERPLHSVAPIAERITQVEQTSPESLPSGIAPLTYQDTIDVARLQGLAYPAAFSELETLAELENYLIGKDINNLVKGRANMSLKATDQTGRLVGYLIAYEGQLNNGTEVLYIEDIAADPNSTRIGGRMINAFIEQYRRNYLEQGNLIPIYTEARGSTSYQILVKHLDRIGSDLGVSFEMRELGQRNIGNGEVMHDIVIVPSRRGESSL